jgi:hypothetical protein
MMTPKKQLMFYHWLYLPIFSIVPPLMWFISAVCISLCVLIMFSIFIVVEKELFFVCTMNFLCYRALVFATAWEREGMKRSKKLVIIPINIIYVDSLLFLLLLSRHDTCAAASTWEFILNAYFIIIVISAAAWK